ATDAAYLSGMRTVVQFLTRYLAQERDTQAIVALLAAVPGANPELARGVFEGIAGPVGGFGGPGGGGGGPQGARFRPEFRNMGAGWPADSPPSLTAEQRATLAAAARSAPDFAAEFQRVAAHWGM